MGCFPKFKVSLKLHPNAKPTFPKVREAPYALHPLIDKELDELITNGIIEKVDHADWGSPLVPIPKSNNKIRLCVDYKVTVNKQLQDAHYPIPHIGEVLGNLRNANYFCTLNLYHAYLHVPVDEAIQKVQTLSSHRGTYLLKKLVQGIKTAPAKFHKIIDQI